MEKSSQKRNFSEKGFSLIELLIVLFVIAILAVIATRFASPRLHAIDYQAQKIMDMLREAKNKAVTTQTTMRLVFNRDQKIVQLISENEPDDPDDDKEIRRVHLADDVDVIFDRLPKNMDSRPVEPVPVPLLVFEDTMPVAMDMSTSEDGNTFMLALYLQNDADDPWAGYVQQSCDPGTGVCVYCLPDGNGKLTNCKKCMADGSDPACPDSSTPTPTPTITPAPTPSPSVTPTPSPTPSPSPTGSPKPTPTPPDGPDTATYRYHRSGIVIDAGINSAGDGAIVKGVTILLWTPQLDTNGAPTENAQILRAITVIGATGTSRFWRCPIVDGRCTNWEK